MADEQVRILQTASQRDVFLECREDVFTRYLGLLVSENFAGEKIEMDLQKVQVITICKGFRPLPDLKKKHFSDQFALLGCAVICVILILVFSAGIATIAGCFGH